MKKIVLIGASGHGKVVADIAKLNGYDDISFLDDDPLVLNCGGYPVVGTTDSYKNYNCDFFVSIGNAKIRTTLFKNLISDNKQLPILVHPNAVVAEDVVVGDGSVIMAGAVINPGVNVGKGCIVNTCASIDHDCIIDDFVHIAVGAHLCGSVYVGQDTWVGAGATIINNVSLCKKCSIGAGAVVIHDIIDSGKYLGIPAKKAD